VDFQMRGDLLESIPVLPVSAADSG